MQFNVQLDINQKGKDDWHIGYEATTHNSLLICKGTLYSYGRDTTIESVMQTIEKAIKHRAAYQFDDT